MKIAGGRLDGALFLKLASAARRCRSSVGLSSGEAVSMPTRQLAPQCTSALVGEPSSLASPVETYLLTSADFETEFAAALEAEPTVAASGTSTASTAGHVEPPVVSASRIASAACPHEANSAALPPLVAERRATEPPPPANEFAPCDIFSASLHALAAPFRSELARETLRLTPTWGGSMLLHMLLVLGLALYAHHETRSTDPRTLELTLHEAPGLGEPEELNHEVLLPAQTALPVTIDAPDDAIPVAEVGDLLVAPDSPLAIEPEIKVANINDLLAEPLQGGTKGGNPNAKVDKRGQGTVELLENETAFFGIKGQGKKFCFIVDNSKSMTGARFRTAVAELLYAVEKLQPDQVFYVCFFSDGAYPLFFPNIAREMIPATTENKTKFREWLRFVELGPATLGSAAMKIGLDLEPDIMFLLGDGDFQDDTVREVLTRANAKTKIHTIGLDIHPRSRADAGFAAIARAFYGTYRNIRLTP